MNLRHPLIAAPIGFILRAREMIGVRKHTGTVSLAEILLELPVWWTPTAKAKAIVGICLALRFSHGFGLLHGCLSTRTVIFDCDDDCDSDSERRIQLADFSAIRVAHANSDPFSGDEWSPNVDVSAFSMLVLEIVTGCAPPPRTENGVCLPPSMPTFVSEMIDDCQSVERGRQRSFVDIVDILKRNNFGIVGGVDSDEVLRFVRWVESIEDSMRSVRIEGFPGFGECDAGPAGVRSGLPPLRSSPTAGWNSAVGRVRGRVRVRDRSRGRGRDPRPPPPAPLPRLRK
jgi:hypothetical protein